MRVSSHTILFTEACPLNCRYCYLQDSETYGSSEALDHDRVMAEVANIAVKAEKDRADNVDIRHELLLTGGEPFLYPDLVKEIIAQYQDLFQYTFNTSGCLLTKDMLRFLNGHDVRFVLSVDGDEALTNYLRPMRGTKWHTGYMKRLREILPTLLYYFPATPFRMIVNPRYVDKVHEMYLYAEQIGFRSFTLVLDFESRPYKVFGNSKPWTDADTEVLVEQMELIAAEILEGWKQGYRRPMVVEFERVAHEYLNDAPFSVDRFPCQVFNGRTNFTMYQQENRYCMGDSFPDPNDCRAAIEKAYQECGGKCPREPDCPAFEYCSVAACPKNSLEESGSFFHVESLECALNKALFQATVDLLVHALEECPDSIYYKQFLKKVIEKEG